MINIYTLVNDAQRPLLDQFFQPTLANADPSAHLTVFEAPVADGNYRGNGYMEVIIEKVRLILDVLSGEDREPVIWSDVDVTFHGSSAITTTAVSELGNNVLAFQQENPWHGEVNTGFMVARRCVEARRPFEKVLAALQEPGNCSHDQELLNEFVERGLRIKRLSPRFLTNSYRRGVGWRALPKDTLVFHANWSFTVPQKQSLLHQFQRVALLPAEMAASEAQTLPLP